MEITKVSRLPQSPTMNFVEVCPARLAGPVPWSHVSLFIHICTHNKWAKLFAIVITRIISYIIILQNWNILYIQISCILMYIKYIIFVSSGTDGFKEILK